VKSIVPTSNLLSAFTGAPLFAATRGLFRQEPNAHRHTGPQEFAAFDSLGAGSVALGEMPMLVREDIAEYVARAPLGRRPKSLGMGRSGDATFAENAEKHLKGCGNK
jgi:hypothetical protein